MKKLKQTYHGISAKIIFAMVFVCLSFNIHANDFINQKQFMYSIISLDDIPVIPYEQRDSKTLVYYRYETQDLQFLNLKVEEKYYKGILIEKTEWKLTDEEFIKYKKYTATLNSASKVVNETNFKWSQESFQWEKINENKNTYKADTLLLTSIKKGAFVDRDTLTTYLTITKSYNSDTLIESLTRKVDTMTNIWSDYEREIYVYDSLENLIFRKGENWKVTDNNWSKSYVYVDSVVNDKVLKTTLLQWSSKQNKWYNVNQELYGYTAGGKLNSIEFKNHDLFTNSWVNSYKLLRVISNGITLKSETYYWDGLNQEYWVGKRFTYDYFDSEWQSTVFEVANVTNHNLYTKEFYSIEYKSGEPVVTLTNGWAEKSKIATYPNPVENILYYNYFGDEIISNIELLNIQGVSVLKVDGKMNNINVSNFKSGIYIFKVYFENKKQFQQKIIIK